MKIVMDTNILFAGLYSANGASYKILQYLAAGRLKLALSTPLLFEYEDVLKRNCDLLNLNEVEIETVLDNLCAFGQSQKIHFLWRPYLPDAKDDRVLELAVASNTQTIVTHYLKDFAGVECWCGVYTAQNFIGTFNMSALSLRLPDSIHRHIKEFAQKEGVSINQFIATAVAEKISALATEDYLQARAQRADSGDFAAVLAKVADRSPLAGDEL